MVHFSGKARKMNHIPSFLRAKRAKKSITHWFYHKSVFLKKQWEMSDSNLEKNIKDIQQMPCSYG
ncbi:MAG: hypothetical protein U5L45_24740 [Saprospiraceae bacterium]|nr:hypothetical protein [Saprospiraceae bacterium]